jgi:hypothetical protein
MASPQDVQAKLDQAVAALKQTTVGYINRKWTTPPPGTNWANALTLIAAARAEAGQLVAPTAPAPVPPPPSSGPWAWDATQAAIDPNSAAMISTWLATNGGGYYFEASVARADTDGGSPAYAISGGGPFDASVYIPVGTQPGHNSDHHLTVQDPVHSRQSDLWEASFNGSVWSCQGGTSFAPGAVQEPAPGNSNAARFPLIEGLITPADIAGGAILHPLVFSMANVGSPTRYPANGQAPGGTGLGLGTWLRLDPTVNVDALILPTLEKLMCYALQQYGMFLRDLGSNVAIYALDAVNQGGQATSWGAVGVTLPITNPAYSPAYPYARQLGPIPWSRMQVLTPPSP